MKTTKLLTLLLSLCFPLLILANNSINLTPTPKQMTVGEGKLTLPNSFVIETGNLEDVHCNEAQKFSEHLAKVTGYTISVEKESSNALFKMSLYNGGEDLGTEGYTLDVTTEGVSITATTAQGFYYAFQSIKKILPPCVMAGVKDDDVTEFSLPILSITDSPRFEYRGFMLDVARHYFEVDEIKRMLDVMSYYKMNRFHWHLVDDQGWRIEIKQYPKLTTVGATRSNSWSVDPEYGGYYTNEPYGPYFYTQEEARDIVKYAKERHIEVIPEIEFPGHACAALAAYPEFSCTPNGSHSVKVDGGIFADVFNVGSPATLQFAKDVIDEIIDIFPYNQIHIGGDECPTSAWENNAECLALKEEMGFSHIRELQSRFVRLLADHVTSKEGDKQRNVIMWNESLSANGTNVDLIKGTNGTMMCWEQGKVQPTALQAAQLGMKSIITPWGPYYINRKQSTDPGEPVGAGNGNDDVRATYNYVPVPTDVPAELQKYYCGVQGTFWTEHVQSNYLLEYLALPRLIAIAETGWTPADKKDFDNFCERITADSVLLNYNNYEYGRHFMKSNSDEEAMVMPNNSTENQKYWYRIVTGATDASRSGKCIELLREGASQIGTGNAQVNRLWNGTVVAEDNAAYDYQLWAVMEDPQNPGRYAIVNKAKPNGSVNSSPTANNNSARWDYDDNTRHYDFVLGEAVYNKNGENYCYSIHSTKVATGMYMNMAAGGQNYAINLWNNPNDGNSGVWEFQPIGNSTDDIVVDYPMQGSFVRITNNVEKFKGWCLADNGKAHVNALAGAYLADVWEVVTANTLSAGQEFTLRNVATGRYISGTAAPITLGETAITLQNRYNSKTDDFSILAGGKALFPMPEKAPTNPNTLNVNGIYPQGTGWKYEHVYQITYNCYDEQGNHLGDYYQSGKQNEEYTCNAPQIKNMSVKGYGDDCTEEAPKYISLDEHKRVKVTYKRSAYTIAIRCIEERGGIIEIVEQSCPIGESIALEYPVLEYYTFVSSNTTESTITPNEDITIEAVYRTEGICGFRAIGEPVKEIKTGKSYLLFNNKDESKRNGFLNVGAINTNIMTDNSATSGSPAYIWNIETSGDSYKVVNGLGCYIPTLSRGSANTASATGGEFTFQYNADGTFFVKGNNNLYWNGNDNHTFTGWDEGHPFMAYEYYIIPYFSVNVKCTDEEENILQSNSKYLMAGDSYMLSVPTIDGYTMKEITGAVSGSNIVNGNMDVVISYSNNSTGIENIKLDNVAKGIFDLTGRHIMEVTAPGIYIIDGKKVYIK
ncbi:MAG: beta-N-acetylhexosaminidase [Bacteroidaceae bacterium]|nr:beta-N-acetylhexosaminidase [Bacteroidaceae bacterium]